MTNVENNVETNDVKMVTIPAVFNVQGARDDAGEIDISKYSEKGIQEFINQAIKVLCQRASASVDGLDKKREAEKTKLAQIIKGDYKAGARKTAEPTSVADRAERQLLMRLFKAYGANTEAKQKKLAKQEEPWLAYYMQVISVKLNRDDVTRKEAQQVLDAQQPAIDAMIATEIEAVKAEDERTSSGTSDIDVAAILG